MSIDLLQRALDYVRFYNPEKDQEIRAKLFEDLKAAIEQAPYMTYSNIKVNPVTGDVGIGTPKQEQIHTSVFSNTHQPEQEPVFNCPRCGHYCPETSQEPVAYIGTNQELGWLKKPLAVRSVATPLYTTPPAHKNMVPLQAITDPENQPSQYGTVTVEYMKQQIKEAMTNGTAFAEYDAITDECGEPPSPLERLRFFCSLAMKPQDWLDVEPFFIELEQQLEACGSWDGHRVTHDPTTSKVMSELRTTVEQAPVQVSPHEFVAMVQGKEHLTGKPTVWAQWPAEEKK